MDGKVEWGFVEEERKRSPSAVKQEHCG